MAEGKYGKLRQVEVKEFDLPGGTHTVHEAVLPPKWDDDEPLFLLRAQDSLSTDAVWHYYETLVKLGLPQADGVQAQWLAMVQWQRTHPERVKLPD